MQQALPVGLWPFVLFHRPLTIGFSRHAKFALDVAQKPLRRFLRVALLIPLFVGCFYTKNNENTHVHNVFQTLARLLGCLLLFFFANVLKTLVAKIMASHFHKEAHFEKMQEALQKVGALLCRAALVCAVLRCAVPCCAVLCCAVLCYAVLCCPVLPWSLS